MKERLQGVITGVIAGIIITCSAGVLAAQYAATDNTFPITYNGNQVSLQGYNIDGSTYFKLRDIADVVGGFNVGFENNMIKLTGSNSNTVESPKADTNVSDNVNPSNIKYDTSFTLNKYYSSGRLWRTTNMESFKITNTEIAYSGKLKITYEAVGVLTGDNSLSIDVKCYDKDGFVVDTGFVFGPVTDGEKFKIKNTMYIPEETVRLEFIDD